MSFCVRALTENPRLYEPQHLAQYSGRTETPVAEVLIPQTIPKFAGVPIGRRALVFRRLRFPMKPPIVSESLVPARKQQLQFGQDSRVCTGAGACSGAGVSGGAGLQPARGIQPRSG